MQLCSGVVDCLVGPLMFAPTQRALLAAIIIGIICAVMGAFVVIQNLAFIGDALAHAAFPGVVIAALIGLPLSVGGAIVGIATAFGIGYVTRRSRVSLDTAIGVLFAGTFALGLALLSLRSGYSGDLLGLIVGDVLAVGPSDLMSIAVLGVAVIGITALLYKEFVLMAFDPTAAEAQGLPTAVLHYVLLALLAITIVIAIQIVGIVLVVAMLVTPAATASILARRFPQVIGWAAVQGIVAAIAGIYSSYYINIPAGPSIVLVNTAVFGAVLVLAPRSRRLGH
ncbi:MAG TPA: metal ABC transporter permease [Herpetosiphonaceae bacterium]|nr:metal ABC transporter permease [Herpetosiphonaceae bacterium]